MRGEKSATPALEIVCYLSFRFGKRTRDFIGLGGTQAEVELQRQLYNKNHSYYTDFLEIIPIVNKLFKNRIFIIITS
jgi:hypothetical protein